MDAIEQFALLRNQMGQLHKISESQSTGLAWDHLEQLRGDLEFDYFGIGVVSQSNEQISVSLDYATRSFALALDEYVEQGLDVIDPAAKALADGAKKVFLPEALKAAPPAQRDNARLVGEFLSAKGYGAHVAVPLNLRSSVGTGYVAFGQTGDVSFSDFKKRVSAVGSSLYIGALTFAHVALTEQLGKTQSMLSKNERRVLSHLANGLTPKEIAAAESKSLSTVRKQLESATQRLEARSKVHAVATAKDLGLI